MHPRFPVLLVAFHSSARLETPLQPLLSPRQADSRHSGCAVQCEQGGDRVFSSLRSDLPPSSHEAGMEHSSPGRQYTRTGVEARSEASLEARAATYGAKAATMAHTHIPTTSKARGTTQGLNASAQEPWGNRQEAGNNAQGQGNTGPGRPSQPPITPQMAVRKLTKRREQLAMD
jgi:hypothetical protein